MKKFFKQRSEIEKEYVLKLTRLQKSFIPKPKKDVNEEDSCNLAFKWDETSYFLVMSNFVLSRKILEELGFRANQHSAISDTIENEYLKEINVRVLESRKHLKLQTIEFRKLRAELDKCYNALNDSLFLYKKSHNDQQNIDQGWVHLIHAEKILAILPSDKSLVFCC